MANKFGGGGALQPAHWLGPGAVGCRPAVWVRWVHYIQIVGLDFITLPGLSCVFPNPKYYSTLCVYMAMPPVLAVLCGIAWSTAKWRARALGLDPKLMHHKLTDNTIQTLLFILFLIYPMLSAKVGTFSLLTPSPLPIAPLSSPRARCTALGAEGRESQMVARRRGGRGGRSSTRSTVWRCTACLI